MWRSCLHSLLTSIQHHNLTISRFEGNNPSPRCYNIRTLCRAPANIPRLQNAPHLPIFHFALPLLPRLQRQSSNHTHQYRDRGEQQRTARALDERGCFEHLVSLTSLLFSHTIPSLRNPSSEDMSLRFNV